MADKGGAFVREGGVVVAVPTSRTGARVGHPLADEYGEGNTATLTSAEEMGPSSDSAERPMTIPSGGWGDNEPVVVDLDQLPKRPGQDAFSGGVIS